MITWSIPEFKSLLEEFGIIAESIAESSMEEGDSDTGTLYMEDRIRFEHIIKDLSNFSGYISSLQLISLSSKIPLFDVNIFLKYLHIYFSNVSSHLEELQNEIERERQVLTLVQASLKEVTDFSRKTS